MEEFLRRISKNKNSFKRVPSRLPSDHAFEPKPSSVQKFVDAQAPGHYFNSKYSKNEKLRSAFSKHMHTRFQSNISLSKKVSPGKLRKSKNSLLSGSSINQFPDFDPQYPEERKFARHVKHKSEYSQPRNVLSTFNLKSQCAKPQIIINNFMISNRYDDKDHNLKKANSPKSVLPHESFHESDSAPNYFLKNKCFKSPTPLRGRSLLESLEISAAIDPLRRQHFEFKTKKKLHPDVEAYKLPCTRRETQTPSVIAHQTPKNDFSSERCEDDGAHLEPDMIKSEISHFIKSNNRIPASRLPLYQFLKEIGKGSFGTVYLGLQRLTLRRVAIKKIKMDLMQDPEKRRKIDAEIKIMQKLSHTNVLRLYEYFQHKNHVYMILEYCFKGDIQKALREAGHFEEQRARYYFNQIASGLKHIHDNCIIHRDIKPDNILIDEYDRCKICDFGVSRVVNPSESLKEQCGTPAYLAPEMILEKGYRGFSPDIWSLGVLLYGLLTGCVLFGAETIPLLNEKIVKGEFSFPETPAISDLAKDLVRKMLTVDPEQRPKIADVLAHPWLQDSGRPLATLPKRMGDEFSFNQYAIKQTVALGFPSDLLTSSLKKNEMNHATACYYLYEKDFETK